MNKISILWMRSGAWDRCPIKIHSLIASLACHSCGDPLLEQAWRYVQV